MEYASARAPQEQPPHPVVFDVEYPARLSRVTTFFRLFLVIPQLIVVYLLSIPLAILTFIAWFAILFTGRYPKAFFDFNTGILRWTANVSAYTSLLRDEYPPFSFDAGLYPLTLDIPYPERQSRFRLFIRFIAIIPNQIILAIVQFASFFTTFIAWWAILFTGTYPRGLHAFAVGVQRWGHRQASYIYLLRDEYPPYSTNANARPGNEKVSAIFGLPFFAAYVGLYVLYLSFFLRGGTTVEATLQPASIEREHPSAKAGSLRITILGYERFSNATAFTVEVEKDGWIPTFFTPVFFSLEDCDRIGYQNPRYGVEDYEGDGFDVYWSGGSDRAKLYFDIPRNSEICALTYFSMSGEIKFRFR